MHSITLGSHCAYAMQDDIHIFRFGQASRRAIDEWLRHLDRAYSRVPSGEPMRCIVQYGIRGMPYLSYSTQRLRFWAKQRKHLPTTYVAVLTDDAELIRIVDGIVQFLIPNGPNIRFFSTDDIDKAMNWLHRSG